MAKKRIDKARYWWAVLYPENMPDNWRDIVGDVVQLPFAYAVHDLDHDSKSEHRKDHVHMILAFPNTTTYRHALSIFKLLGETAVNTCEACVNIRHCYDYLLHDTDSCKKQGKEVYPKDRRIVGNNFDIGAYEQISTEQKQEMLQNLVGFVIVNKIMNMTDFYLSFGREFDESYWQIVVAYNRIIESTCTGNWRKYGYKKKKMDDKEDESEE